MPLPRNALGIGAVLLLAAMASPAYAAADYYLRIGGIDGTSSDRGHEGWIEATGINWETGWTRGCGRLRSGQGMRCGNRAVGRPGQCQAHRGDAERPPHTVADLAFCARWRRDR